MTDGIGAELDLTGHADGLDAISLLFGESQGRAVVSVRGGDAHAVLDAAKRHGVEAMRIGTTGGETLSIRRNGVELIESKVAELRRVWTSSFAQLLSGDTIETVIAGKGHEEDLIVA